MAEPPTSNTTAIVINQPGEIEKPAKPPRYPRAKTTEVQSGSVQTPIYGEAKVKVYPINESQLSQLGLMRGVTGICFTIGAGLLGFGVNLSKDLQLSASLSPEALVMWDTIRWGSLGLGGAFVVVAFGFWVAGHITLWGIKRRTSFGGK